MNPPLSRCPLDYNSDEFCRLLVCHSKVMALCVAEWFGVVLPYAAHPVANINNEATAILYDNKKILMECRERILPMLYSCQVSNCYPFFLLGHVVILFNRPPKPEA